MPSAADPDLAQPGAAPLLATRDLAVGYPARGTPPTTVLAGVSLQIAAGELICVLGPNGAGKSTLLRTLAGMQPALAGKVEVLGRPLDALRPRALARRIGVVLPERARPGMLSAAALVALGRYPYTDWLGRLRREDEAKVRQAIAAVGVAHLAERDVASLSDGERQKVMIARALAQEPTVMVLDEPTAFLDLPGRVEILALLRKLAHAPADPAAGGRAVVLSTHDLDLALHGADRVWLLDGRGGLADGAPEDLVLGGALRDAFERDAVRYDPRTGSFRVAAEPTTAIVLRDAGGLADLWTRRALARRGFEVRRDEGRHRPEVEVVEVESGWRWRLSRGGGVTTHSSIAELLEALGPPIRTADDANNV